MMEAHAFDEFKNWLLDNSISRKTCHCGREISVSAVMLYCPYCGERLSMSRAEKFMELVKGTDFEDAFQFNDRGELISCASNEYWTGNVD